MTDFSDPIERLTLMQRLSALPPAQLNQLIVALNPPSGNIPSTAAPALQVSALLEWVQNPDIGCGWETLATVVNQLLPPQKEAPKGWFLVHPYGMPPHFTGRKTELQMLTDWLTNDASHPLLVLRALGGFGKSALTWHWLTQELQPETWPQVMWWSFYEQSANFGNFLRAAVLYLVGGNTENLPPRQQLEQLLTVMHKQRVLLVLDGFERELRAYGSMGAAYQGDEDLEDGLTLARLSKGKQLERDCINPLAD